MANSFKKFTIRRLIEPYAKKYVGWGSEENYNAFFNPVGTTVDLADTTADINTTDKYLGKPAYDETLGEPVWATGPDPSDAWVQASGTTAPGAFTFEPTNNVVSVGAGAALTASAADNFLVGRLAGNILSSGDGNVIIGRFTGNGLTTGDDNICIGQNAGPTVGSTSDKLFVGQGSGTGSPLLYGHTGATGKFLNINGQLTVNDNLIDLNNSGAATASTIINRNSAGGVTLNVNTTTGNAQLGQTSGAGAAEDVWVNLVRNAEVNLRHNNVAVARTALVASGGFEVNNTVTGAGFERVLTTADLGGGGSTSSTWTPTLICATTNPTQTYAVQSGDYTRTGDEVVIRGQVTMGGSITAGAGSLRVGGLPFTPRSNGGGCVAGANSFGTGTRGAPSHAFISSGNDYMQLQVYDNDAGNIASMSNADGADVGDFSGLIFSAVYYTDDA